ncbi:MAG TPA: nitrate reductase [Sulfurihydrogenibium sp.]|uniref:nitrate reductase n=1 Tax=Sulfurihydrogenibium sp. (strain YO3AOP1) TaxID=436114 RepID=UPI00017261D7|nr:nitrate reductase [Sulfurihydrogenibium sp. YO3AOP1]ACD65702.1 molybdopterin oxidoreductase [Sulfurihydrogenibium sp. YO3AOP1]HBT97952.1 nitrate reductase [Sulfurihydrogenibium sp.]
MNAKFQCPYCGVGCGLIFMEGKIKGNKQHPANLGDICKKPLYYPKVMNKERLEKPMYRESKKESFIEIDWGTAYDILKQKIKNLSHEELYFYISGQLMTEDIYVINKFVKGFLRTNNIDSNSRLCMATAVVAYKLAFGSDGPPCNYEDIDDADTFIFAGSNAAWTHPVLFKRVLKRKNEGAKIVVIDPVKTETAKRSDIHIQIRAGTDIVLFNSVLYVLYKEGWIDKKFIENYVEGFEEAIAECMNFPPDVASKICEIEAKDIYRLAEFYAFGKKVISLWCQGLNQSSQGTNKNLALINLHLATGRLNNKGCPFSLTGQPNAMGGREMGYLSNGLPGYRDVRKDEDRAFVENFWGLEKGSIKSQPGPTITEAVDYILDGKIKFLWVVCTNPAITLPNLNKVRKALENVFLVVQDAYWNESCSYANLILPAAQMGEKEGIMTGSDRTITFCQKFSEPPGESKPDWQIFKEFAHRLGFEKYFSYENSKDVFEELKEITKGRLCDISSLSYENMPMRWGKRWLYENLSFPIDSGKAKMHPASYKHKESKFILTTGRTKNQWHTMTRTGKSPELLKNEEEPFLLMNQEDALELGILENETVEVISENGKIQLKVRFGDIKRKHLFAPFGYGKVNELLGDDKDPLSKEPELKFMEVELKSHGK